MSIQDLGSIGELVAAIATLATLIYLAVQVNELKKAAIARGTEYSMGVFSNWRRAAMNDTALMNLLEKASGGSSLTEGERIRLEIAADDLIFAAATSHSYSRESCAIYDSQAEVTYTLQLINRMPPLRDQWFRFRPNADFIAPDFGDAIDAALRKSDDREST